MLLAWQEFTAGRSEMQKAAGSRLVFGRIMEAYGRMLLQHGLFQADVHPGEAPPSLACFLHSKDHGLPGHVQTHWVITAQAHTLAALEAAATPLLVHELACEMAH